VSYAEGVLTTEQISKFHRDGFLVIEDFVTQEARDRLKTRALELVEAWEPGQHRSVFTTDEQERASNIEFLESGASIWCFFESEAFDAHGELRQDKSLSINKIGHAMHDLDPVFEEFTYTAALAELARDIGLVDPMALQSMYIFKQPGIGGEVGCHQDATFLYTDPITVTGFWFAIEDATIDNGCLWAAPGGHKTALRQVFQRRETALGKQPAEGEDLTRFVTLDETPLPAAPQDLVPLEVPAGTLVVLHGLLPHWSDINRSPISRHAYTVHCVSGAAQYPEWNWLQRPGEMPLQRLDRALT
jgi:phytanoyl-CoA hydroxylase